MSENVSWSLEEQRYRGDGGYLLIGRVGDRFLCSFLPQQELARESAARFVELAKRRIVRSFEFEGRQVSDVGSSES